MNDPTTTHSLEWVMRIIALGGFATLFVLVVKLFMQ